MNFIQRALENKATLITKLSLAKTFYIILIINFILRLIFNINANEYSFGDASSYMDKVNAIGTESVPLIQGAYFYVLSYIAYFFKTYFGSIVWFFVFQSVMATLTVFLVSKSSALLSGHRVTASITAFFLTIYMEFNVLSTFIYPQVMMIFFTSLLLYLTLSLIKKQKITKNQILLVCLLIITVYASLFFRRVLNFSYLIFFFLFLWVLIQRKKLNFIYLIISVFLFIGCSTLSPQKLFNTEPVHSINGFIFMGHTDYGGLGGEGTFIYEENRTRYFENLDQFLKDHNIVEPTDEDNRAFMKQEMTNFMFKTPHKWIGLQFRKLVYTYSIVPVREMLQIMMTGKANLHWSIFVLILQLPFILIMVLFILFFNIRYVIRMIKETVEWKFYFLTFMYLIVGVSIYGHYAERYRMIAMVIGFIPLLSIFLTYFIENPNKYKFNWKRIMPVIVFLGIWAYQAYEALIMNSDRYFSIVQ